MKKMSRDVSGHWAGKISEPCEVYKGLNLDISLWKTKTDTMLVWRRANSMRTRTALLVTHREV